AMLGYHPESHTVKGFPTLAAPEDQAPVAAGGTPLSAGIPALAMPTPQQSILTGMGQTGNNAKQEGKLQFQQGRPSVNATPGTEPYYTQRLAQDEYKRMHPLGSPISENSGIGGKIEHVLGRVGNIAGNALIPNVMATTPGTDLNNTINENKWTKGLG